MRERLPLQLQKLNYGKSFHEEVHVSFDNVFIDLYTGSNKLIYVSEIRRFTQFSLFRLNLSWVSFFVFRSAKNGKGIIGCLLLWEK